jgi:hypothetical protein
MADGAEPSQLAAYQAAAGDALTAGAVATLAGVYTRFADHEAAGRSPLYAGICRGVADDASLLARLAALPLEKQQPNLLLAAVKYRHGVTRDWPHFRDMVMQDWDALLAIVLERRTQTNEPARCATLLPLLASLPQPLALLEVGASAGLCLLPDRYAYDFGGRKVAPSAPLGAPPLFHCKVNAATPIPQRNVDVVWRAGLDLNPLDCTKDDDARWLQALVWPGEGERHRLLGEALAVARRDPPAIFQGDLRTDLPRIAEQAPKEATLVIFHTAVLAYVRDAAGRQTFADSVRGLKAQWVSNESASVFDQPDAPLGAWGQFFLSLNGRLVAHTDPHGTALDWLA